MAESEEQEARTERRGYKRVRGVEREERRGKEHVSMAESARRRSVTPALAVRASGKSVRHETCTGAVARARAHTPHGGQRVRADATASVSEQRRPPVMWAARYFGQA